MAKTDMTKPQGSEITVREASELRVALARVHRQLRARIVGGLTASQTSALARIEQHGPIRLTALSDLEGISPATMNKLIDSLVERGLVERLPDPADGRASLLRLGAEGDLVLQEIRSRNTEALREALRCFDDDERNLFRQVTPLLERLSDLLLDANCATR